MSVIEIRPFRGGWQCFEGDGVQPYFVEQDAKRSAIQYATQRMRSGQGEIHVYNTDGVVEETLRFDPKRQS